MRFFTILSIPSFFFLLISCPPLISCSTLISCTAVAQSARFVITNNCPYTVWAAAVPGGGRQLNRSQAWPLDINVGRMTGRIWARTNCRFDLAGNGSCETGDCSGLLQCEAFGEPPNTLFEFALNQFNQMDFIDMSLIDGFNVPMEISSASGGCNRVIKCTADIMGQCPAKLKVPGGCNGPCSVFKTDEYCCTSGSCGPTNYSRYFKDRCPDAYSFPKDDATSTSLAPEGQITRLSSVLEGVTNKQLQPYMMSEVPRPIKARYIPCNRCIGLPSLSTVYNVGVSKPNRDSVFSV